MAPAGPSSSRTWTVAWTGEGGTTAACTLLRGSTVVRAETACTSPTAFDLTGLPDGTYTVEVRLTDAAGNTGPAAAAATTGPALVHQGTNVPSGPAGAGSGTDSGTGSPTTPLTDSVEYENVNIAKAMRSLLTSSAWSSLFA